MANQIARRGRPNNYLQHFVQGAGQLAANPGILQGAGQVGRFIANQVRQAYDNRERYEGEEPQEQKKMKKEEDENMQEEGNIESRGSSSITNNSGFVGSFFGNTKRNTSYEKYYHEAQMGHSKKLKSLDFTWGMSKYGRRDNFSGEQFPLKKYGTDGAGGKAYPGIVCIPTKEIYGSNEFNPFASFGNKFTNKDLCENVYANCINLYLGDFIDNKLLNDSGTAGFFINYNKFRLKSITVELNFISRHETITVTRPNIMHSAINNNGWNGDLTPEEKTIFRSSFRATDYTPSYKTGYFVYRDVYGTYSNVYGVIDAIPGDAVPGASEDVSTRRQQYVIKNIDKNLTYVDDGETFSFTREINSNGSYYLSRKGILANLKTPIGSIIAQLEGQITGSGTDPIVNRMPEFFNLLFVPGNCEMQMLGEFKLNTTDGNGYIILPKLITTVNAKFTSKWEAFDFNYAANHIGYSEPLDPLVMAEFNYNVEKTINVAKNNRINNNF